MRFLALAALVIAALAAAPKAEAACACKVHLVFLVDINSVVVTPQFVVQLRSFMYASLTAAIAQANCNDVSIAVVEFGAAAQVKVWIDQNPNEAISNYVPSTGSGGVSNVEMAFNMVNSMFYQTYGLQSTGDQSKNVFVIQGKTLQGPRYSPCHNSFGLQCDVATVEDSGSNVIIAAEIVMRMKAGLYVFCPKPTTTTTTTTPLPNPTTPAPPADVCFQCRSRRNHKDLYEDETDCHYFYQCFYVNETYAIGFRRRCPIGQFWHDPVLSCMPEGDIPCQDQCLTDDSVAAKGCFAGNGCRQFFVCSNTGSYGMCCPEGTTFNSNTCGCDEEPSCNDPCQQQSPVVPTTVAPVTQVNATVCVDSFGSPISVVPGEANAYVLIGDEGEAAEKKYCPAPLLFDLTTCRCNIEGDATTPVATPDRKALVYLTFDGDAKDQSIHKYATFLYNGADVIATDAATGTGSLAVNGGYLSIPGLKTFDFRQAGSWAGFFRGTGAGGILSNNKDSSSSEYTVVFGTQSTTSFLGKLKFWAPVGAQSLQSGFTPTGTWNHFCVTYDGNAIRLYINGVNVETQFIGGYLAIAHCPYVVGTDQEMGTFNGSIDEILITPFAMTEQEINAHRTGDRAFLQAQGFF